MGGARGLHSSRRMRVAAAEHRKEVPIVPAAIERVGISHRVQTHVEPTTFQTHQRRNGLIGLGEQPVQEHTASISLTEAKLQPPSEGDAPSDQHTDALEDTKQDSATDCGS